MTMLLGRTVGVCITLLVLGAGSAVAVREVNERANQPVTAGAANLASADNFALDPVEQADQAKTPDCAKLKRLALQAEVQALAVQFAQRSQSPDYADNIVGLQTAIAQIQSVTFPDGKIEQLRQRYLQQLQSLPALSLAAAPQPQLDRQVQQVTQFNREQIVFNQYCL